MEYFGLIAFVMILCYSSYPSKVKKLETRIKQLEKKQKGDNYMSKLISELVGKKCKIKSEAALQLVGNTELMCLVLDVDDEWIKINYADKKSNQITKLLRIENIEEVEMTE